MSRPPAPVVPFPPRRATADARGLELLALLADRRPAVRDAWAAVLASGKKRAPRKKACASAPSAP